MINAVSEGGALVSLVITMSSEIPQRAGIAATHRISNRPKAPETSGFLETPAPAGTARGQFKSPLRHHCVLPGQSVVSPGVLDAGPTEYSAPTGTPTATQSTANSPGAS